MFPKNENKTLMQNKSTNSLTKGVDTFNEADLIASLKHFLPTQTPLKDFIHHNSLHAFQEMKFYDAIFKASKIFGFEATLPLNDFRKLYELGRIDPTVLDKIIMDRKGTDGIIKWKEKVLKYPYDEHNEQRIGKLRAHWKKLFQIDLDN